MTITSSGTASTMGAKFKMPVMPQSTSAFVTSWATAAGTVTMAILTPCCLDKLRQRLHRVNRLFDFLVALAVRLGVERGDDFKSFLFKAAIREQREAEVADAHQDDRLQPRRAEFLGDLFEKLRDIVAQAARAERAEIRQVFAQLRGLDAGGLGERLAGNGADAVLTQPREAAQIDRKAINRLARDFRAVDFFQRREK